MNKFAVALSVVVFFAFVQVAPSALAHNIEKTQNPIPHLDLEMMGSEYVDLVTLQMSSLEALDGQPTDALQIILTAGKRNLDWLKFINDHRDEAHKISLSSPATQAGIPIDQPRIYNPDIISKNYQALLQTLPREIKSIIENTGSFPLNPPMADADYITWAAKIDSSYQIASRWLLMAPYLDQLAQRRSNDVRGYYFLSQNPNLQKELTHWSALDAKTQKLYGDYLEGMCLNNDGQSCAADVSAAVAKNTAFDVYNQYVQGSKNLYDSFFKVLSPRNDVKWDHAQNNMLVPFTLPQDPVIKSFLTDNIQDEWHWDQWHLLLDFQTSGNIPEITFEAGATPHVNGLGGNSVTMDANQPLTEYNVRWTIRHEFGHVLGFPDCYVEFYDKANAEMISYQLDITNLMCSRRGHLQERHYSELKRVYAGVEIAE